MSSSRSNHNDWFKLPFVVVKLTPEKQWFPHYFHSLPDADWFYLALKKEGHTTQLFVEGRRLR